MSDTMPTIKVPTLLIHPTADTEIRRREAQAIYESSGASRQDVDRDSWGSALPRGLPPRGPEPRRRVVGKEVSVSGTNQTGPARLDALLAGPGLVVAPGVFDGFSARAVELSGYSAAYVTGAGGSLSNFGLPDLGLITQSDMVDQIFRLGEATTLPLIVDGDTGFGSVANVVRTVRRYERAGAAAIQLEDQVFPKRCGHLDGKEVLDAEQFAARIAAACDARVDDRFKIIARTDAIQPLGLDAALDRANRYAAAGADLVFVEAPKDLQHVERIASEVTAPKMINMISASVTPMLTFEQLERYGFALAIYPMVTMASAMDGIMRAFRPCVRTKTTDPAHTSRHPSSCSSSSISPDGETSPSAMSSRTLLAKLWDDHVVAAIDDDTDLIYIDLHLIHKVSSPQAFAGLAQSDRPVRRPDRTFGIMDHVVPTGSRNEGIPNPVVRRQLARLAENCSDHRIQLYDLDSPFQGIAHGSRRSKAWSGPA